MRSQLNAVHPFSEGNGRAQRLYLTLLALDSGRYLPFAGITQERMVSASISAFQGDLSPMRDMMLEQLDHTRRAALVAAHVGLSQAYGASALDNHFLQSATPGHRYAGQVIGIAGDHFILYRPDQGFVAANSISLPTAPVRDQHVDFIATMTPLQAFDHALDLAEQHAAKGELVAAITAVVAQYPEVNANPTFQLRAAERIANASGIDAAYRVRHP